MTDIQNIFSADYKTISCDTDILLLTGKEFETLPAAQQSLLRHHSISTADLKESHAIRRRIAEYVTVRSFDSKPTQLADINRRFNAVCGRAGTKPTLEVAQLVAAGVLGCISHGKQNLYFNRAILNEFEEGRRTFLQEMEAIEPGFTAKQRSTAEVLISHLED